MTQSARRMPVLVLISGRGSNMVAIARRARAAGAAFEVCAVLSDHAEAPGLTLAHDLEIDTATLPAAPGISRTEYDRALAGRIERWSPGLIVLAGFMRILGPHFVRQYSGRVLNVHPSLLPSYPGLDTHRRVLEAGDREHGASVHFVTEALDAGPLIIQGRVPVFAADTVATLSARVQAVEHRIYPQTVQWFAQGRLEQRGDHAYFDGRSLTEPLGLDALEETIPC